MKIFILSFTVCLNSDKKTEYTLSAHFIKYSVLSTQTSVNTLAIFCIIDPSNNQKPFQLKLIIHITILY